MGFRQEGRIWIHPEWNIAVDIVASSLVEVEDKNRIRRFKAGSFTLNLYGLEDLIVQRLCSAKYWHYPEDLEQAATLLAAHKDRIDTQYLQRKAEKEKVDDLLQKIKEKLRL